MRTKIYAYAIKYQGNYQKIYQAIRSKEKIEYVNITHQYVTIVDKMYPDKLRELQCPPLILFYKGDLSLLNQKAIGIVGSRLACQYAVDYTEKLVMNSQEVIVSGLAKGVDAVAHKTALINKKPTIAVLGCGIDYIYPYQNKEIYRNIEKYGLIISEYPGLHAPKPWYFPFRNRIIAALSAKVFVMQAAQRSGTMTTVNEALELNRPVYVLPYRLNERQGEGSNQLIQEGASLIDYADFE